MSSQSEVGHNKNVANFEELHSRCTGLGTAFNPAVSSLKLVSMGNTLTLGKNAIIATIDAFTVYKNATNEREILFKELLKRATRVKNALDACGVTPQTMDDSNFYLTKLRGVKKAKTKRVDRLPAPPIDSELGASPPDDEKLEGGHSSSQRSFDSQIQHFEGLVTLTAKEAAYAPNEEDLKVTGLKALLADLKAKNTACVNAHTAYSNAMINRDKVLYAEKTGLTFIAKEVKAYVKSVFGARSAEYSLVSGLKFTTRKI